jgi:Flp pilus assembly protein TadD
MEFGVKMAQRGLWSEALFRFEQAQRQAPGDPRVLNNLAVAYEATGQFDKALASYQQALQAAPTNRELRRNYARFVEFYQSFRPQEAVPETAAGDAGGSAAAADGGGA